MMTTEGTYPFHRGGVSTWCDMLLNHTPSVEYVLYAVLMNPFVVQKFRLPSNVSQLIKVPLWGTEEPSEHLVHIPFSRVYLAKRRTSESVVRTEFLPVFDGVVRNLFRPEDSDPVSTAHLLQHMYRYFSEYDYQATFKSESVWDLFKEVALEETSRVYGDRATPCVWDLTESLGWLYRFFVILNTPVPRVHVTHSAAAAFCGVPCVLAKLEYQTPYLLSEHGVYLREQYIGAGRLQMSLYSKLFLLSLVKTVTRLNYEFADVVAPVCEFNTRWERQMGVPHDKIKVIYNGVDPAAFASPSRSQEPRRGPTVVCVARIDPIKDIETLIRAAALVRNAVPEVRFMVYGAPSSEAYFERCLALRAELRMERTFIFAGHTTDVAAAYRSGDVVALSSISEGFPYSVIEAMMSGKPVVATNVGGVREALQGCGLIVRPRQPEEMAAAIVRLLRDERLRAEIAEDARNRALTYFTISQFVGEYLRVYRELYRRHAGRAGAERKRQAVFTHRAYAFVEQGMWREALTEFRKAVNALPSSPAVPALLAEMARCYNEIGQFQMALLELEKAEIMANTVLKGDAETGVDSTA